jgi:hypothetical protein
MPFFPPIGIPLLLLLLPLISRKSYVQENPRAGEFRYMGDYSVKTFA